MKTAEQAKTVADASNKSDDQIILDKISKLLDKRVEQGYYQLDVSEFSISLSLEIKLKSLGYKYSSYYDQRDNVSTKTISW